MKNHYLKHLISLFATLLLFSTITCGYSQVQADSEPYNPTLIRHRLDLALKTALQEPEVSLQIINQSIKAAELAKDNQVHFEAVLTKSQYLYLFQSYDDALIAANLSYLIAIDSKSETNILQSLKLLSTIHIAKDIKEEVLEYLYKGLGYSYDLKDTTSISYFLSVIPNVEIELGNLGSAMKYSLLSKDFFVSTNDTFNLGNTYITLAFVHQNLGNFPAASKNIQEAIELFKIHNDSLMLGKVYIQQTNLYLAEKKYSDAEKSCIKALDFLRNQDEQDFYKAKSNYAEVFICLGDFIKASEILNQVLQFQQNTHDYKGLPQTLIRMGNLELKKGNSLKAIESFKKSIKIAQTSGSSNIVREGYKGLSESYSQLGSYSLAFKYLRDYVDLTDSVYNLKKVSEASKMEEKVELENHEKEIRARELEIASRTDYINQQRQKQVLLYLVLVLFFAIFVFAYREFRHRKLANIKLAEQKDQLEIQKHIAEKQTRDFTDSLNYARRIQQAILRASLRLKDLFPESFLLLIPREIVSGDFYWTKEKNGKILFALADCTGHGVPGAFMSIIGTYGLNKIVNEQNITNPTEILNQMNELFLESLEQRKGVEIFDGMDIAVCSYNAANMELSYAGANIPLHICRRAELPQAATHICSKNQTHVLYQVRPNKQPVGSYFEKVHFVTHSIKLYKDDIIYLFSDGFADQFGGPEGKKFRSTELRKLLCNLADTSLDRQRGILEHTFNKWKGKRNQVDDVSFMGLKI